jgi:hypothetical protein
MANWCNNYVVFSGSAENLNKLNADLELAIANAKEGFTLECVGTPNDGYMFDAILSDWERPQDLVLSFESKWSPIVDSLVEIAKHYSVAFECDYEECGNLVFGQAVYSDGALQNNCLSPSDFDLCVSLNEDDSLYAYNGEQYECMTECLEAILKDKIKREAA